MLEDLRLKRQDMRQASTHELDTRRRWYRYRAVGGVLRGVCEVDPVTRGRAEQVNGGYDWIRSQNGPDDRAARLKLFELTQRIVENRGYVVKASHTVPLRYVTEAQQGTCLVSPTVGQWPPCPEGQKHVASTEVMVAKGVVLNVAGDRIRAGRRVVAMNAASAYSLGGGVTRGGRHALEESMCMQSTLYSCLAGLHVSYHTPDWVTPAKRYDGQDWEMHIPNDGAILTPSVEIFRKGTFDGYVLDDAVLRLDGMVSVAMPNCNTRMSDSPKDAHPEAAGYAEQVEQKWRAALVAACLCTKADSLVLPDAGCGVFMNNPGVIGGALGHLLRSEFGGRFAEVILAFPATGGASQAFADAALETYAGTRPWPPASAPPAPQAAKRPGALLAPPASAHAPVEALASPGKALVQGFWGAVGKVTEAVNKIQIPSPLPSPQPSPRRGSEEATPNSTSHAKIVWEFGVASGYQEMDKECQDMVEAAYQTFTTTKEPSIAAVPSRGKLLHVDFTKMVQWIDGNNRTRKVRRRELS